MAQSTNRASDIQRPGEVEYRGFVFPAPISSRITSNPVPDSSGRQVKYIEYTLTIDCFLTATDFPAGFVYGGTDEKGHPSMDVPMETLRGYLQQPGYELKFNSQGFGTDVTIDHTKDLSFGPHPRISLWEPLGGTTTVHIVWECNFTVSDCPFGFMGQNPNEYAAFVYSVDWGIGQDGATTRSVTGHIEFKNFRTTAGGMYTTGTPDLFRDKLNIPILEGFTRQQSYRISEDRRTLFFSVVDSEVPSDNPYFPYCLRMDVRHRLNGYFISNEGKMFSGPKWTSTLSGTIELAPGTARFWAWKAFKQIIKSRRSYADKGDGVGEEGEEGKGKSREYPIYDLSIEEEIYGRSLTFNITWGLTASLDTILHASGLATPIKGPTWSDWKDSLRYSNVYGARGYRKLRHLPGNDVMLDICGGTPPAPILKQDEKRKKPKPKYKPEKVIEDYVPEEDESWLLYWNSTNFLSLNNDIVHTKLGGKRGTDPLKITPGKSGKVEFPVIIFPGVSAQDMVEAPVHQRRGVPRVYITIKGFALRVGHKISAEQTPRVITMDGTPIAPARHPYTGKEEEITFLPPIPLYGKAVMYTAVWTKTYLLPKPDTKWDLDNQPPHPNAWKP